MRTEQEMMRGISAVLAGVLLIAFSAESGSLPIDYTHVGRAGVARMMGQWVRYIVPIDDSPCITIQLFKAANMEGLIHQKEICSLGNKQFHSDFTYVAINKVEPGIDHVRLEISFIPLRSGTDDVRDCSIAIRNGFIGDLECPLEHSSDH